MRQVGITNDNKPVFGDTYKYCGTYGLPLGILIDEIEKIGGVIDWESHIADMRKEGANFRTIRARILAEHFLPPLEKRGFMERLDICLSKLMGEEHKHRTEI